MLWRAEAHSRSAWDHTVAILAMIAETNRNPKKRSRPFVAEEFHPHRQAEAAERRKPIDAGIGVLKMFAR